MFGIGAGEFVVILIVGLIVFGPSKLPELGRALGKTLREFRKAQAALSATLNESLESEKKSAPVAVEKPVTVEKTAPTEKSAPVEEIAPTEKSAPVEKTEPEKNSAAPSMTADDVINLAKERPIVKENHSQQPPV